jgi:hypothetical protein
MGPLRWKIAADTSRSQAGYGPNQVVGPLFSPLQEVGGVVFHAVACRAPINTLARPKSV